VPAPANRPARKTASFTRVAQQPTVDHGLDTAEVRIPLRESGVGEQQQARGGFDHQLMVRSC